MSLGYTYRRLLGVCLFLSIFIVQSSLAQGSGTIKGQVVDQATGDPLPGANIVVVNTSIGSPADLDGNYTLRLVPTGKCKLKASYIGYDAITREVTITENATLHENFRLTPHAIMGIEVVVTAQARGQQAAINQQLTANTIMNVVSEERIQELPDFNAAAAISRLPGVSTLQSSGEANKVVIRGLAPQYNTVSVGGIKLASTGSTQIGATSLPGLTSGSINQDRSVDISMITPYMIKTIQVYKSLTPDMNANAIGGIVNMELREAPSEFHGDILWQSGYTQKSDTYGNYRAVASGSGRFFDDALGVYLLVNAEQYDRSADNMTAGYTPATNSAPDSITGYKPVQVISTTLQRHIETRNRYGGNLILDFKLPSGSIKSINMLSRLNSDYKNYQTILDYYYDHNINFTYRKGNANTDVAVNTLEFTNDFGFMSVVLKAANTYSRNNDPRSPYYQFFQTGGTPPDQNNTVPDDLAHNLKYNGDSATYLATINLFSADYKENDQVYKGDFKIPFNLHSNVSGFFKFGGEYDYNLHTNDQNTPYISPGGRTGLTNPDINGRVMDALVARFPELQLGNSNRLPAFDFTNTDSKLYSSFLNDRFGRMYWVANANLLNSITDFLSNDPAFAASNSTGGWFEGVYQKLPNDYKYIEKYYAAYLMAELDLGQNLIIVGGARYEDVKSLYEAHNMVDLRNQPPNQPYYDTTAYPRNHYLLPQVQMKYNLTDWCDMRYSYTQALARPDYHQLSPHYNINSDYTQLYTGNSNLKPAQAYNHDVEITFHSNELGLLSIGGFYKTISHFTYYTQYRLYSAPAIIPPGYDSVGTYPLLAQQGGTVSGKALLNTYINSPYNAYVKGIEADFQTSFWYLPFPLNGVVLGINYTHIWSSATYPLLLTRNVPDPNDPRHIKSIPKLIDSSRAGRLIYQPNDILNTYIGYDYLGFSARVSFLFQGNSVTNVGGEQEQDGFSQDYFRLDASARYKLPWFSQVQLFLDISNINQRANISAQKTIGGFTNEQFYGLTANLGVRYTL
ncbi:MAG: TonB-dependent receptor [Bacteroidota bacterium]